MVTMVAGAIVTVLLTMISTEQKFVDNDVASEAHRESCIKILVGARRGEEALTGTSMVEDLLGHTKKVKPP